jgi:2-oxoisovalerate dehydrogenase E2 component (dihydrolipoyl transacylase)
MEFRLPELGEGVYEAELVSWHVKPGDVVEPGQNLIEVLTDKATMEVPAPFAGVIGALHAQPGTTVKVGDLVLDYQPAGASMLAAKVERPSEAKPEAASKKADSRPELGKATPATAKKLGNGAPAHRLPAAPSVTSMAVQAAPSVRYLARKLGIDLGQLHGSGPGGRVLLDDLTQRIQASSPTTQKHEEHPEFGIAGSKIKLKGLRRKIAEHMVAAKRDIPHYSYVDEFDATALVQLRDALKPDFAEAGIKLTYLAFVVKAVVEALKHVPIVNSSLDTEAGDIALHGHYHIGVAVSTPGGLVVPVVHDADKMELAQVAIEIERLSSQARAGKIQLADIQGGTFTVTSVGNIGGLFSTPIIHQPQVGILGLGKMTRRPVFDDAGNVRPADMQYLSFSFDHRVVDGAVGAAFGNAVIRHLRNPARLLLPARGLKGT